jgi:hypothetical protein
LEGEIYNAKEVMAYFGIPKEISLCDMLLTLFIKRGSNFVTLLNGEFNIVIFQKDKKKLTILNDHLSSKPMYYLEKDRSFFFGSEKKSILAVSENSSIIDPLGLLEIFAFSHNLRGRTFIKGIKRLPPSSELIYKNGRITIHKYPSLKFWASKSVPKIDLLIEGWCEQIKQATEPRLKDKKRILINLSGGLDSRALALAIPRNFRPIFARTKGFQNSREVLYATEIARRLDFGHYSEDPGQVLFSDILPKVVWRTECAISFVGCLSMENHIQMKEYADFQIGGAYGNTSAGSAILPDMFLPSNRKKFINRIYQRIMSHSAETLHELFNREFLYKLLPFLKNSFFNSFEGLDANTNIKLFEIWNVLEMQPQRTLSSSPADSYLFEHIRPFIDKNYLNFVMKIPTWLRFGPVLYHTMISRLGPEISDIPYANTNLKIRSTVLGNIFNKNIELGLKVYKKILGNARLPSKLKYVSAGQEGTPELIRKDKKFRSIIEDFVISPSFDPSIFNAQGIMNILDKHYRQNIDCTLPLCLLATFAVGLPYFITNRPSLCPPEAEPLLQ